MAINCLLFISSISCFRANVQKGASSGLGSQLHNRQLNIGLIVPYSNFGKREYLRAINLGVSGLAKMRGAKLTFLKDYDFQPANVHFDMMTLNPSPTAILNTLCKQFLHVNVSAILYIMVRICALKYLCMDLVWKTHYLFMQKVGGSFFYEDCFEMFSSESLFLGILCMKRLGF